MSDHDNPETVTGEPVLDPTGGSGADGRRTREGLDPRERPPDPAGTRPKHDPEDLLPARRETVPQLGEAVSLGGSAPQLGTSFTAAPPASPAAVAAGGGGVVAATPGGELAEPLPPSSHAPRFQFLLGALGAIAAAGVAIAIAIVAAPRPGPGPAWSVWHPVSGDVDPAQQIADHVAPEYRLDNGHQIVQIQGGPLSLGGQPAELAIRTSGAQPALLPGNGVIYELCGSGPSCSIGEGTPSAQRLLLLRREALELALYTFRYVDGVNQVVVTVPPPPPTPGSAAAKSSGSAAAAASGSAAAGASSSTSSINHALLFRPGDVTPELDRPLGFTLGGPTPTVSTVTRSQGAGLVNQLTTHNLYDFSVVTDSQSNPVLLLQPPGLGG